MKVLLNDVQGTEWRLVMELLCRLLGVLSLALLTCPRQHNDILLDYKALKLSGSLKSLPRFNNGVFEDNSSSCLYVFVAARTAVSLNPKP